MPWWLKARARVVSQPLNLRVKGAAGETALPYIGAGLNMGTVKGVTHVGIDTNAANEVKHTNVSF